jgi:hypothetical protein
MTKIVILTFCSAKNAIVLKNLISVLQERYKESFRKILIFPSKAILFILQGYVATASKFNNIKSLGYKKILQISFIDI